MGLNDEERSVIVNLEIEKANNTYSDVLFFINEERWEAAAIVYIMLYFMRCQHFSYMTVIT